MKLMVLALAGLLLASCGERVDPDDGAPGERDSRPTTIEWTDGKGDMWAAKFAEDSSFIPGEPRPTATNGDIRHVTVAHRAESLVIKVQYLDLNLDDVDFTVPLRAFVDTDVGLESEISLNWDGTAQESSVIVVNENSVIDCSAASATVDNNGNTATVRVPRSCLGVPRWVRVYVESEISQSKNYQAEPAHMDSAMDAGFPAATRQDGTLIERALSERVYVDSPSSPSGRGETTLLLPDARGDVVSIGGEAEDFSEGIPAPQRKDGDILSTKVEHRATQLRIRVEIARLVRRSKVANYRLGAELKTNAGTWGLEDDMGGRGGKSRPILYLGEVPVPCDVDRSIDYANRTSTLIIPRACLGGDPAWVQISLSLVTRQPHGVATLDDAQTAGYDDSTIFSGRVFKP
jgi:hypothetical protein